MTRSDAYRDGFSSRREGGAWQDNPFTPKTPQWSDWRDGWRDAEGKHEDSKARERWLESDDGLS
ncbi:hypothetical protein [Paraburkholderia hospita]|uniref:hypothetical protein n=1 Tax=Paraburkholderia hospita TaxID=169430 RepID=UPI001054B525|nr:hypothetical protein [Paraburkholderia hospita]